MLRKNGERNALLIEVAKQLITPKVKADLLKQGIGMKDYHSGLLVQIAKLLITPEAKADLLKKGIEL